MKRGLRKSSGVLVAAVVFCAMAYASSRLYWITIRETHRAAEWVGIMDPNGDLGGQVARFNYQRNPRWVYPVGQVMGAAVAYGPALVAALLVMERVERGSWRASVCGKCGARMRRRDTDRSEQRSVARDNVRCAACGEEL
jgi:hypothetical protein